MVGAGPPRFDTEATDARVVCFCDIPVTDLSLHMNKYSRFGLSFLKPFLISKGANPVLYVANNSPALTFGQFGPEWVTPRRSYFEECVRLYTKLSWVLLWEEDPSPFRDSEPGKPTEEQRILVKLDNFLQNYLFSFLKYFDDTSAEEDETNVYMEREWRVLGDVNFSLADVHRVFMPERYAERFRADLPGYSKQLTFSDSI